MKPIFAGVFAEQWDSLPPVLLAHYANRPFTRDHVTVEGTLDVEMAAWLKPLSGLIKLTGMLTPYAGKAVPVTVHFFSEPDGQAFVFQRIFAFPGKPEIVFRSRMVPKGAHEVIEYMKLGVGWRASYHYDGHRVVMRHLGYVLRVFGRDVPLPGFLGALVGHGNASEQALSADTFVMRMEIISPLFGKLYAYGGTFRIAKVTLADA
jgi:hypothetical protein